MNLQNQVGRPQLEAEKQREKAQTDKDQLYASSTAMQQQIQDIQ